MTDKIFIYDNSESRVRLNVPEILLVKEFAALMSPKRNKCKEDPKGTLCLRAFREFTYIWLAIDWSSIYADYDEQDRHKEALNDSGLTEKEFDDKTFREACRKYKEIRDSNKSIRMLMAARTMVDKLIDYFETTDPTERDEQTNRPIFKVKDIQVEMNNLIDVHTTLIRLEQQVKKQIEAQSQLRGNAIEDFDPGEY